MMYHVICALWLSLLMSGGVIAAENGDQGDICQLPPETGKCRALIPAFFYNSTAGQCQEFVYGGCEGNANRFGNQSECQQACPPEEDICQLPAETGRCRGSFKSYFYNPISGQCEQFIYGGCGGNANRFALISDCQQACPGSTETDVCKLPAVTGPCRAFFRSYFYNPTSGQCEQFIYGGCRGNANRFRSQQACQQACPGSTETAICKLPAETGTCRAYIPSYFYNATSGQCEQFTYGGCGGNANRFASQSDCQRACSCKMPPEAGICLAYSPSYFYNSTSQQCEQFIYGGCGGNGNRFALMSDCEQTCFHTSGGSAFGALSGSRFLTLFLVVSLMRVAVFSY